MNGAQLALPNLLRPWPDWGRSVGFSRAQTYSAYDKLPANCKTRLGGRVFILADRLKDFLESGGDGPGPR